MVKLKVNGKTIEADVDPATPLLWVLRDYANLTGTKFGCGIGLCGACTVHIDGVAQRSCMIAAGDAADLAIVTIEGLSPDHSHAVQQAWIEADVPQCGYCQPGMVMAVAAFLKDNPNPSDDDINANITNICRCGTYPRVREAIKKAATKQKERASL